MWQQFSIQKYKDVSLGEIETDVFVFDAGIRTDSVTKIRLEKRKEFKVIVQRQMCPSRASAMVFSTSTRGTGFFARRSSKTCPSFRKPAVQYPHWNAK